MDCGTGKTFTSILKIQTEGCDRVLVTTLNSIKYVWQRELFKCGEHSVAVCEGHSSVDKKIKTLQQGRRWNIINYESLISDKLFEFLLRWQFDGWILDESTAIKNPKAKRTKRSHKLASQIQTRLLLTGTPMPDPLAVWAQMYVVDSRILGTNYYAFCSRYAVFEERYVGRSRPIKQVVGYQNVDELIKKIEPLVFFCKKEDCLDLPPKTYEVREVEPTPELLSAYKGLSEDFFATLKNNDIVTADNAMAKATYLQQMLGGVVRSQDHNNGADKTQHIKENKSKALLEVLDEIGAGRKAVVFCRYLFEIHYLQQVLKSEGYGVAVIQGDVEPQRRDDIAQSFNAGDDVRVLLCQSRTAGYGIDLTGANYIVFYSNDWSVITRMQDEDRCHRQGQNWPVTIIDIVTKLPPEQFGPGVLALDEMVYRALMEKKNFEDYIKKIKWEGGEDL